jgi:N-acetylglucosaminyldiphosphoundecaprenol N-acetyl-beta-D-mannosaminyltransferase
MTHETATGSVIEWHALGNVRLSRVSFAEATELIAGWAGRPPFRLVVTPNVDHVITLQKSEAFRAAYAQADLALVDGRPVQWAARYLGLPPFEKVSGSDLLPALCARGAREKWRIFFAGGASAADLRNCLARIGARYPGLVLGGHCPPRGFEHDLAESARLLAAIQAFSPDLLMMAVGAPKSEIWLARHADSLGRGVGLGVGAGMRMLAGLERRAPRWMQRAGLEWCWRLAAEPGRLWKRYLVDDMQFFPLVWRWKRMKKH